MKIKEIREGLGLTQTDFALKLSTTQNAVSRWESGTVRPRIDYLKKIAALAGCTVEDVELPSRKLSMKEIFTSDAYECLTAEERRMELKRQQAAECSGWRRYPSTMSALHARIPTEWWSKYTAEHIGEVMSLLKIAFDDGATHGKNHPDY